MKITLLKNGPIFIASPVIIEGENMDKVALCRCGTSKNKPFCDGGHETCNFEASQVTIELSNVKI